MSNCQTSIKGQVKVQVIDHLGRVVRDYPEQPNLLLNQGMDNFANVLYCDLFAYAAKGNSAQAMKEAVTGTYTLVAGGTATVTRVTGSRNFVPADIGKLIRTTNVTPGSQVECIIQSLDVTTPSIKAHVIPVGGAQTGVTGGSTMGSLVAYTGKIIALYSVQLTGMDAEDSRSSSYSNVAGENSTVDAGAVRNFKRTFLFDPEAANIIHSGPTSNKATWSATGTTVTKTNGTRDFATGDVGKYIKFISTGEYCKILTRLSATVVTVDRDPAALITVDDYDLYGYNSYSHIGFSDNATGAVVEHSSSTGTLATWDAVAGTVTRTAGTRNFVSGDVGKFLRFASTGEFCKILTITSTTVVAVDRNPAAVVTADSFSFHSAAPNLNILVRLETTGSPTPVLALGENPEVAGQQVKVTYTTQITFYPAAAPLAFADVFSGDKAAMGGFVKTGNLTIEGLATSRVTPDGTTDSSATGLEPSATGYVALSPSNAALVPVASGTAVPDRSNGLAYVDLVPDSYDAASYTRTSSGTFGINDGNGNLWRTFGIYDPNDRLFLLACLWASSQKKPPTHQFSLHFRKTWNRDLG